MKNIISIFSPLLLGLFLFSCSPEQLKDITDQMSNKESFAGSYALDDGSGLTSAYVTFSNDKMYQYAQDKKVVLAENYLWFAKASDFTLETSGDYSVSSGILYCNGVPYGKVQLTESELTIEDKRYRKILGLKEERYTSIQIEGELTRLLTYQKGELSIPVSVTKTIPSGNLMVLSTSSWLSRCEVKDGKLELGVGENNSGYLRTASVVLSYPGAENVTLSVKQEYSTPSIVCSPSYQDVDYMGGDFSLTYTIANPREEATVTAVSQSNWITGVKIEDNVISYHVAENNSGSSRTGYVNLSYGSYASKSFIVSQSYALSSILMDLSSVSASYIENNYVISYTILNPRQDATLSVSSNADWIKVISVTDCKVEFRVSSYSRLSERSAVIHLVYGLLPDESYATGQVSVSQQRNPYFDINSVPISSTETSNSYLITSVGQYKFPTVKGNSTQSIGQVASAEVLWESYGTSSAPVQGDIVDATYLDGYIHCLTPSTLKNGNAVIVAKDASGNILWSWHIWVCSEYDPIATAQEYYNNAGTMMDRNLGATSATPGEAGSLGLLYQWGRKDPFLGSSSVSSNTPAASTRSWPSPVSSNSDNGTIAYAIKNPMTFIERNIKNQDWYYTGDSSTDNTRWSSTKTIYDPCPPGWRVPDGGENGMWSTSISSTSLDGYPYDDNHEGVNFSGKFGSDDTIWYPAAGIINNMGGGLVGVGNICSMWSCTTNDYNAYRLYFNESGNIRPSSGTRRAEGSSVRCVQE